MDGTDMSTTDAISVQVVAILAAQALCDPASLTPQTPLEQLGIDSMGMAEILFAIEESFDVAVPFNANTPDAAGLDLSTVGTVCAAVQRLILEQKG
jgi:acyl carrier protein